MSRLTRDRTAESVSRDQILRRERGQGNINFPCSADHDQDWQSYQVDPPLLYVMTMCVCVFFPFILDVRLVDVPAGATQVEGRRRFLIHLPSAVLA